MPTKLDEISRVIGNIDAEVRGLSTSVADVRSTSAEQQRENRERLESIDERVEKIEADTGPLAETGCDHGAYRCRADIGLVAAADA